MIVVTFAKQTPGSADEQHHQGFGVVDAFDTDGNLIARVATHGQLNAPWGIALAPSNFGAFSGDLLIGNFGDGQINAYARQADGTWERMKACRADDCKYAFLDTAKNRSRAWCSMQSCGNRAKVAAYRERHTA
jgi:uncharacterized protein (TIGR03118 family)